METPVSTHSTIRPPIAGPKHVPEKRKIPDGWWCVDSSHKGHKGMKDATASEIANDPKIPAHWKAALLAEISARKGSALEIHAHAQDEQGGFTLSIHLKPLF